MTRALVTQAVLFMVLVLATLFTKRGSWRTAHVLAVSLGTLIIAVTVLTRIEFIPQPWQGLLTIAYILKNVSLLALIGETYFAREAKRVSRGHCIADTFSALRESSGSTLASSIAAGAEKKEEKAPRAGREQER